MQATGQGPVTHTQAHEYAIGQRFRMRQIDARAMWPGWESNKNRVPWSVTDHIGVDDRLLCKYRGRTAHNRQLIGNDGVCEFTLTQRFRSRDTLLDLLGSPASGSSAGMQATGQGSVTRKRAREYAIGQRFHMRRLDARAL
eukprot:COSAG01_NODE_11774_length_1861_cov_5.780931_2_plen_140_part_01